MLGAEAIRRGYSCDHDPTVAVAALHAALDQPRLGLVVFFCSATYDLDRLAEALNDRFAGVPVIGCTTAGEITPVGYQARSITGFSLAADGTTAVIRRLGPLSSAGPGDGFLAAEEALAELETAVGSLEERELFGLLLIDGMSTREERVVSSIHWALGSIPLLGGSAGDDMHLESAFVFHDGRFHTDAALLTLVRTSLPFRAFKAQHFRGTDRRLVVTRADPERRIVYELNAEPAALEYARAAGLPPTALTQEAFAERALMVKVGGDFYVRSIQRMREDGSLVFLSAIDEGVVLTLAEQEDLVENLDALFTRLRDEMGEPALVIGFDCVLRSVEAERRQVRHLAGRLMAENNVIGFSTYGEQYRAMHVNQTFTGVAIGCVPAE